MKRSRSRSRRRWRPTACCSRPNDSAKAHLLALINTDARQSRGRDGARQSLGNAYLKELRGALARNDLAAADAWLNEAQYHRLHGERDLKPPQTRTRAAREKAAQRSAAPSSARIRWSASNTCAPKIPAATRNRGMSGWVELEFTVRTDGSTGDIVVTNSNPRRTFDNVRH